jgi:DNA mismatch repair protein MSH3
VNKLATADCLLSLAHVALQENYVRPSFTDDDTLEIVDGRHPMVESLRSDPFIPNSIQMGGGQPKSKILTGPNMGGYGSLPSLLSCCSPMLWTERVHVSE